MLRNREQEAAWGFGKGFCIVVAYFIPKPGFLLETGGSIIQNDEKSGEIHEGKEEEDRND